jgi:hypothetical protein
MGTRKISMSGMKDKPDSHLSVGGWLMQLGGKGCGKCGNFVYHEISYTEGEWISAWKCIACSEIAFPDPFAEADDGERFKVFVNPTESNLVLIRESGV